MCLVERNVHLSRAKDAGHEQDARSAGQAPLVAKRPCAAGGGAVPVRGPMRGEDLGGGIGRDRDLDEMLIGGNVTGVMGKFFSASRWNSPQTHI
jgi:hypothetical protein